MSCQLNSKTDPWRTVNKPYFPRRVTVLFSTTLLLVSTAICVQAQQTNSRLAQLRVIEYGGDLGSLLGSLSSSFEVVIGFEVARSEPQSFVKVSLHEATAEDIMNAIVANKPIYTWRKTLLGFEVLPRNNPDQFLDSVISSFHVENASPNEALKSLVSREDVVGAFRQIGISDWSTNAPVDSVAKLNMDLNDVTIREAVSQITAASGLKYWTYKRTGQAISITIFDK